MPRKTKAEIVEILTQRQVDFDPEARYDDLAKLLNALEAPSAPTPSAPTENKVDKDQPLLAALHTASGISLKVLKIAREVGLTWQQLEGWTDEEKLKATIIQCKPAMAARLIERPDRADIPPATEPRFTVAVAAFDVSVLAGGGTSKQRAMAEDRDIDVQLKKRGISRMNIASMNILRSMKADGHNRLNSTVTVKYRKQL